jgi:hypothetical protein
MRQSPVGVPSKMRTKLSRRAVVFQWMAMQVVTRDILADGAGADSTLGAFWRGRQSRCDRRELLDGSRTWGTTITRREAGHSLRLKCQRDRPCQGWANGEQAAVRTVDRCAIRSGAAIDTGHQVPPARKVRLIFDLNPQAISPSMIFQREALFGRSPTQPNQNASHGEFQMLGARVSISCQKTKPSPTNGDRP